MALVLDIATGISAGSATAALVLSVRTACTLRGIRTALDQHGAPPAARARCAAEVRAIAPPAQATPAPRAYGTDMASDPDYRRVMADWRDSGRITGSQWRNLVHGPGRYTCPATGNSYAQCVPPCSHMTRGEYAAWEDGAEIPGYPERKALADAARNL